MRDKGVLIVFASTGTGHRRAAEALAEACRVAAPHLPVTMVDLLDLAPRWVRAAYGPGYETVVTRAPRLWGGIYRMTDIGIHDRPAWGPLARKLLFRGFRDLLRQGDWSACVSTHFLGCQLASGAATLQRPALVVTDFELHRVWLQPSAARVFVATEALARSYRSRIRGVAVEASGIPVSQGFAASPDRADARRELELDSNRPVALVMGGGLGIGVEEAVGAGLTGTRPDVQIIAVCGRNEQARHRLSLLGVPLSRLRVFGHVSGIDRFISAADLVATKPGGLTISESLALGKPLLLTTPIPGAEQGNLRVLTAAGAAVSGCCPDSMRQAFGRAFSEPGVLAQLAANAAALGRPNSARTIAESLVRERPAAMVA